MKNLSFTAKLLLGAAGFLAVFALFFSDSGVFGQQNIAEGKDVYLIGSSSVSVSPTNSFTAAGSASGTTEGDNFRHQTFFVNYTPRSYGARLELKLEGSPDRNCANYYPYSYTSATSSQTTGGIAQQLVYASGTEGVPYVFPAIGVTASGTNYRYPIETEHSARCFRISARELATSTAGNLKVHTYMSSE